MIIFLILILGKGYNIQGPSRGHGHLSHWDAIGPMLTITSTRGARSKNTLNIIIIGHREIALLAHILLVWALQAPKSVNKLKISTGRNDETYI